MLQDHLFVASTLTCQSAYSLQCPCTYISILLLCNITTCRRYFTCISTLTIARILNKNPRIVFMPPCISVEWRYSSTIAHSILNLKWGDVSCYVVKWYLPIILVANISPKKRALCGQLKIGEGNRFGLFPIYISRSNSQNVNHNMPALLLASNFASCYRLDILGQIWEPNPCKKFSMSRAKVPAYSRPGWHQQGRRSLDCIYSFAK